MKHALTRRLSILVLLLSPCCVNIYVQFPETAIEEAAEGIVDEVRPEDRSTAPGVRWQGASPGKAIGEEGSAVITEDKRLHSFFLQATARSR